MEKCGLDVRAVGNLSYHYHRTVDQRRRNFETHWGRIRAIDPFRSNQKFRLRLPRSRWR
jgi:cyclopropane fatty-acyl-phospholipid synthase-like methyltransferase